MTEKNIDGIPIDFFEARFTGTFGLPTDVGEAVDYDDTIAFVVVGSLTKANVAATKSGDVKRTNVFEISEAVTLSADQVAALPVEIEHGAVIDAASLNPPMPSQDAMFSDLDDIDDALGG